jgi:hypothetical protein
VCVNDGARDEVVCLARKSKTSHLLKTVDKGFGKTYPWRETGQQVEQKKKRHLEQTAVSVVVVVVVIEGPE